MARKKKVVYREPNPHDVAMWKKVEVMRHLTFEEKQIVADFARQLERYPGNAIEVECEKGLVAIRSIDDLEFKRYETPSS